MGTPRHLAALACALAALAVMPATAGADTTDRPWPPRHGDGRLFVHFGEEHWNDADGLTLLPRIVEGAARYRPAAVTMSGDKANDGDVGQLSRWEEIMRAFDDAGVPYFAATGNHDRNAAPGAQPGFPGNVDIGPYKAVFADRPYPFGDAKPYDRPGMAPSRRPLDDPKGAATHYFVDVGAVRWIFIDNSCFEISKCESFQAPSGQNAAGRPQFDFLADAARAGSRRGMTVFVVMHMPTRDPGDQSYRDPIALNHVMAKGATSDNETFERIAEESGVDGVFVGHIKGQFLYRGRGGVPYFIDGGAGGELYTEGPVGTDHGFWHGYRLVRVSKGRIVTDAVPIFVRGGISIEGPDMLRRGEAATFAAFGRQPVFNDPAKVEALELRDPAPVPREGTAVSGVLPAAAWIGGPLLLLLLVPALTRRRAGTSLPERRSAGRARAARRRVGALAPAGGLAAMAMIGGVAVATTGEPTSTPPESLPNPARIWTSDNPLVLRPVASADDDPRRDRVSQTADGRFAARCPGRATLRITSGWETASRPVTVRSSDGPMLRRYRGGARVVRRGRSTKLAEIRLAQPAEVLMTVRRGRRVVRTLVHKCGQGRVAARWDGRLRRRGKLRSAPRGRYVVDVRIRSDRRSIVRKRSIRLR